MRGNMLDSIKSIAAAVAECSELIAVVVILIGTIQAIGAPLMAFFRTKIAVGPLLVFR